MSEGYSLELERMWALTAMERQAESAGWDMSTRTPGWRPDHPAGLYVFDLSS